MTDVRVMFLTFCEEYLDSIYTNPVTNAINQQHYSVPTFIDEHSKVFLLTLRHAKSKSQLFFSN